MPTLVLPPRYTDDSIILWRTAIGLGWEVERLTGWNVPPHLAENSEPVVLYGEPLFANLVAERLGLALLEPSLDWLTNLPARYVQRQIEFTTLAQARKLNEPQFVKPARDKSFPARIYSRGADLPDESVLPGDTAVLVAEPVVWQVEYRCFVLDGRSLTYSPYWRDGQSAQHEDGSWPAPDAERESLLAFANAVLSDPVVELPPAVVVDVGLIQGRGPAVIEANSAWGAGLYGCDPDEALKVIQRACLSQSALSETDRQWVLG